MEKKKIFILPGEMALARNPTVIATLLGSCVAICLFNNRMKFGGMNHFMLPTSETGIKSGKYGDYSTEKLIEGMLRIDKDFTSLTARIYGGASVVGHLNSSGFKIGERNIEMGLNVLKKHGVKIVENKTGGTAGLKIYFENDTGDVDVKMIAKSELTVRIEEKKKDLSGRRVRTLIVDDSSTVRSIIRKALSSDPKIHVVGEAEDAFVARNMILELDPDVITLDIIMPKMDGVSFLKKLMIHYPKPVIIVSSVAQKGSKMRLRADDIGAVDILDKEDLKLYEGIDKVKSILCPRIVSAASAYVKKREAHEVRDI